MGNGPSQPAARPSGAAKIKLDLDGPGAEVYLSASTSWWDETGALSEASLQVSGEASELYDLLLECTTWMHRRWKRQVREAVAGPFDERPV